MHYVHCKRTHKFDPKLGYGDDDDFQSKLKRLCKDGKKIVQAPDSIIYIHYPQTLNEFWSRWTWWGRTSLRYLSKNPSLKVVLNLGSDLLPTVLLVLGGLTLFSVQILALAIFLSVFLIVRNLIACYRSKSIYFFEFICYEFMRSTFFTIGIGQGLFEKSASRDL